MDESFRRLTYIRYADDFLIGVIGIKENCEEIKKDIGIFLNEKLKLTMSIEKIYITNSSDRVNFLGYDIVTSSNSFNKKLKDGRKQRVMSEITQLLISHEKIRNFLLKSETLKIDKDGKWKTKTRNRLLNNEPLEIVTIYNSEIRGFYNYYSMANNISNLHSAFGIFKHSFIKTLGGKHNGSSITTRRKMYTYKGNWGVWFTNKKGEKIFREFYNEGFRRNTTPQIVDDIEPSNIRNMSRTKLTDRLKANVCEYCGVTESKFEVHHIRKMKDIKDGKSNWEKMMIVRNRKTMVLCTECHHKLHNGRL